MKKTNIGLVTCPVCTFADAGVKEDKNGHAYVHCADCNTQVFTRNDFRDAQLRKRMRAVTVTVTEPEQQPDPAPAPRTAPPAPPAPKRSGWFQTTMSGD